MSANGCSSRRADRSRTHAPRARGVAVGFTLVILAFVLALGVALPGPAAAQIPTLPSPTATSNTDPAITAPELNTLIQTLENDQSRADFVQKLKSLLEAQRALAKNDTAATGDNWLARFSSQLRTGVANVAALGASIDFRRTVNWLHDSLADPIAKRTGLEGLVKILAILCAGILAHIVIGAFLTRPRKAIEERTHETIVSRFFYTLLRFAIDFCPLAVGTGMALAVAGFIEPRPLTRLIALAFINALVASEILTMFARLILSPRVPNLRIAPLTDETAYYLYIWTCRLGYVTLYGYFALEAFLLMGLSKQAYGVLTNLLGLVIALLLVIFILQNRDAVAGNLRGSRDTESQWDTFRRPLAAVWHLLAIFYVVALYLVLMLRGNAGTVFIIRGTVLTALILLLVWLLDGAIRSITRRGLKIAEDVQGRFPGLQTKVNRYTAAINITLRAFIALLAAASILEAWGVQVFAAIASPFGQRIASATISIVIILALALTTWELVSSLIERQLTATAGGRSISTRALTLLPLARTALRIVLVVLVIMVVLAQIGVNITPLLAGAGVIGLAVGFGAQKLVQDVITGWFILMEDTISVGDNVDLGGHAGAVERINIRTIQLRDGEGGVHTIPFSAVNAIVNKTRDFAFYQIDVGVSFNEDTDRVVKILQAVGEDLSKDPVLGNSILAPVDIDGVERFDESAVILRTRIRTRVGQQGKVGHEFNRRLKKAFDANGIELPYPHRTIYMGSTKDAPVPGFATAPDQESAPAETPVDKNIPHNAD